MSVFSLRYLHESAAYITAHFVQNQMCTFIYSMTFKWMKTIETKQEELIWYKLMPVARINLNFIILLLQFIYHKITLSYAKLT